MAFVLRNEEIGINAGNWVGSAQDRDYWRALVNAALHLWIPYAMELVSFVLCLERKKKRKKEKEKTKERKKETNKQTNKKK